MSLACINTMLVQLTENIRQELIKMVPASVFSEITCFVLYDNHPRDEKFIDVIVCTIGGEIKEFYKRELVSSLTLDNKARPTDIKILRNGNCELFYLVITGDELTIISRKDNLRVHRRVRNVEKYEIEDSACRGQACLKIICKDDAVPMVFDDNFENLGDRALVLSGIHADDSLPILTQLMRKLTETKYSVRCNENTLKEFLSLRQLSALSSYKKIHPNTDDSIVSSTSDAASESFFTMKSRTPWIKVCNQKIVINLILAYTGTKPLEDVQVLLHGTSRPSMVYKTRLFKKINKSPFWIEIKSNNIKNNCEIAVAAVIDVGEIKHTVTSKIEFSGVITYKKNGTDHLIPFDHVIISALETMHSEFDVLSSSTLDSMTTLAILATTNKTEMLLRHIKKSDIEPSEDMPKLFCSYLHMEMVDNTNNTVIYRNSPYHMLNGVLLVFEIHQATKDVYTVYVYTRSSSQILSLMHYMYEAIPHKLILTKPEHKLTMKTDPLSQYNEALFYLQPDNLSYNGYASSLMKQVDLLIEYFDNCMIKMSDSKNPEVMAKIGTEIDFYAQGVPAFLKLKEKLLKEASKGVSSFNSHDADSEDAATASTSMVID